MVTSIPFFLHKETQEPHPQTLALLEKVAQRVEKEGIECWQQISAEDLLGKDAAHYDKSNDTLDVWFDSGSTFETVMGARTEFGRHFPAEIYLEGSDQHRGWFHSSLLISCAVNGVAPYRSLLTHGFAVDGQGRKMSKSLGNTVVPQKISDVLGAEILRMWTGLSDYSGEQSISDEILKRVVESYRRIRNTLRFLLANTADFDVRKDALPVEEWLEIDRYALVLTDQLQKKVLAHFEQFEFQPAMQAIQNFCSEDLGGFYLDILKDRLYTAGAHSKPRRAAQTTLYHILQSLTRLIAPVLSFTAEEIWQTLNKGADDSVFLYRYYDLPIVENADRLVARWTGIRMVRGDVMKEIEEKRSAGLLGSSLRAEVDVTVGMKNKDILKSLGNDLRFVFITSSASVNEETDEGLNAVVVKPSQHSKCERCWHYRADVGSNSEHPTICGRCISNLFGEGEKRFYA